MEREQVHRANLEQMTRTQTEGIRERTVDDNEEEEQQSRKEEEDEADNEQCRLELSVGVQNR